MKGSVIPGLARVPEPGFGLFTLAGHEEHCKVYISKMDGRHWHIDEVFVEAEHRRQGLGDQMLAAICAAADVEGVALTLEVGPFGDEGPPARTLTAWYKRFGFTKAKHAGKFEPSMVRWPLFFSARQMPLDLTLLQPSKRQ